MALEEYKRKRDFKKTSEPAPGKVKASKGYSYLVQKHDATRLHYDFRLELDGVLLSWAVTRGPSLNPADKRLAVRTEDHPLSYGSFEGTIPQGEYGGGTVMLWDTGEWEPKGDPHTGLKKGHLSFSLKGERLQGGWGLIKMRGKPGEKRENWLLVKEDDEAANENVTAEKFLDDLAFSIKTGRSMDDIAANKKAAGVSGSKKKAQAAAPMKTGKGLQALVDAYPGVQLATLVDQPPQGDGWVHEIKFDGYRLLGFLADGATRLRTRNGHDWTDKFHTLADDLTRLKADSIVLDMEAVVLNDDGKSSFEKLQASLGEGGDGGNIAAYVFDILSLDGKDLSGLPLLERKEKLAKILKASKGLKYLHYSDHVVGHGDDMIAKSCQLGLEGIISKEADAPYVAGRQKSWLKSKCGLRQEFIILGMMKARKGNRAIGALYLGYYKGDALLYAGKVGTGFSMQSARDIADKLDAITVKTPTLTKADMSGLPSQEFKEITWVKPKILCEVAFTEWTSEGHIRHPSFQGLRTDKKAAEVKMEKPVPVEKVAKVKAADKDSLVLEGITITHPERVISETGHVTKGQLAEYYAAAAPFILKGMKGHPLSLLRCPGGIDGDCFYQRNPGRGLGPDVKPFHFKHKGKGYEYLYVEDAKGLIEVVQMGAIELHPWGARVDKIDYPNRMIFDLDPDEAVPFEAVKLAALDLRKRLKEKGLESTLKCTGGKGLHVTVPLAEKNTWEEVKAFAEALADDMVAEVPEAYVATMTKAKRTGKIFIDFFRNDYTATAIADYAVRAREGAPVAVPLDWSELKALKAANQFTIADAMKRLKKKQPAEVKPQRLP